MIPSSYGPFELALTQIQRNQLKSLLRKARALGIGASFSAEVLAVLDRLERSPREWGDPLYSFQSLQLLMYRGVHQKISVTYGVHERLPIVFVKRIDLILDHPLAGIS